MSIIRHHDVSRSFQVGAGNNIRFVQEWRPGCWRSASGSASAEIEPHGFGTGLERFDDAAEHHHVMAPQEAGGQRIEHAIAHHQVDTGRLDHAEAPFDHGQRALDADHGAGLRGIVEQGGDLGVAQQGGIHDASSGRGRQAQQRARLGDRRRMPPVLGAQLGHAADQGGVGGGQPVLVPADIVLQPGPAVAAQLERPAVQPELILADADSLKPSRVVFDSLSELRLLAGNPLRYRRQILALKQFFATRDCTVLLLDDMTATDHDLQMRSIAHGVLMLEQLNPEYRAERRRLRMVKYRGVAYRGGYHDYLIEKGGIVVFPRLIAAEHRTVNQGRKLPSDIKELDALLGGGIEEGTSTLIVGSAGESRPATRTGSIRVASPFLSSVSRKTPQTVAGPFAGARRSVGSLRTKRATGAPFSMPMTES